MADELAFATATWLAERIRRREVSSLEVVDACLERIAVVDPRLNAVVRLAEDARDRARAADDRLARHGPEAVGPLHGVPFTLKDSIDTAGLTTTAGTVGWRDRVPTRDATVASRALAAGAILLGKTNTPEFTWSDETDNEIFGRTNNPYDLDRTPGGSSGGAAAIVAAGGSPFDIGSDTGDSIRQPAHVCGVAGLKPTSGRVPRTGHHPDYRGLFESFTQLGPIARRVEDLGLILRIIAGPDGEDPHIAPVVLREARDVTVGSLRVVTFTDNGVRTPTTETIATVRSAADALRDAGATVEERLPPDLGAAWEAWSDIVAADGHAWLQRLISAAGTPGMGSYDRHDWFIVEPPISGDALTELVERADAIRANLLRWMQGVDVIVCPAMPQPAIRHGESGQDWFGDTYSDIHNLTGWPAAVVRGGTAPGDLPIGVQCVAPPWREDLALAAATVIETASGGWRRPPL